MLYIMLVKSKYLHLCSIRTSLSCRHILQWEGSNC